MLLDRAAEKYWKKSEREGETNSRWELVERLRCWEMAGVNSGLERDFLQPCVQWETIGDEQKGQDL